MVWAILIVAGLITCGLLDGALGNNNNSDVLRTCFLFIVLTFWTSMTIVYYSCIDYRCWVNEGLLPEYWCAEEYVDMMYEEVKDDDIQDFIRVNLNLIEWMSNEEDNNFKTRKQDFESYVEQHKAKADVIEKYAKMHKDKLPW